MLMVNNRGIRKRCEIWPKLIIKTPKQCHWLRSGVFIVNFKQISYINVSIVNLEQVNGHFYGNLAQAIAQFPKNSLDCCSKSSGFFIIKVGLLPSKKVALICFNESPLKMTENAYYFMFKSFFSFFRYLHFCPDFLVMLKNGLIRKAKLISKFRAS